MPPVPTDIDDLSTTAASNFPAGTESPNTLDDYIRAHAAFIAELRNDVAALDAESGVLTAISANGLTAAEFSSIPAGVNELTIMATALSLSAAGTIMIVQIGDSGGFETSGYSSGCFGTESTAINTVGFTTAGFAVQSGDFFVTSAGLCCKLVRTSGNSWACSSTFGSASGAESGGGTKTLSATLDRVRLTTVSGVPTFNNASAQINVMYR